MNVNPVYPEEAQAAGIEGTVYPSAGEVALVVLAAAAVAGLLAALPVLARRRHSLAHALAIE